MLLRRNSMHAYYFTLTKLSLLSIKYHSLKEHHDFLACPSNVCASPYRHANEHRSFFIGTGFAQRWCQIKYQMSFQILLLVVVGLGKTYLARSTVRTKTIQTYLGDRKTPYGNSTANIYILILWCQVNHDNFRRHKITLYVCI